MPGSVIRYLDIFINFDSRWDQSRLPAVPPASSHAGNVLKKTSLRYFEGDVDYKDEEHHGNDYFHSGMVNVLGWTDGKTAAKFNSSSFHKTLQAQWTFLTVTLKIWSKEMLMIYKLE